MLSLFRIIGIMNVDREKGRPRATGRHESTEIGVNAAVHGHFGVEVRFTGSSGDLLRFDGTHRECFVVCTYMLVRTSI